MWRWCRICRWLWWRWSQSRSPQYGEIDEPQYHAFGDLGCWEDNTGDVMQLAILNGDKDGYWRRDFFVDNMATYSPRAESIYLEVTL